MNSKSETHSRHHELKEGKSKEVLPAHKTPIVLINAGGTWAMKPNATGQLAGNGFYDDATIARQRTSLNRMFGNDIRKQEEVLAETYARDIRKMLTSDSLGNSTNGVYMDKFPNAGDELQKWCPDYNRLTDGKIVTLYTGDSSQLVPALAAPLISGILQLSLANPGHIINIGQGTDDAQGALLNRIDVLTWGLGQTFIGTGSNHSRFESTSDAPAHFTDMAKLSGIDIGPGAFWVFEGRIYLLSDLNKSDPNGNAGLRRGHVNRKVHRKLDEFTFLDRRGTSSKISNLLKFPRRINVDPILPDTTNHIVHKIAADWRPLFNAMNQVYVTDLGLKHSPPDQYDMLTNERYNAIIVAAYSVGNGDDVTKSALTKSLLQGKLVFLTSRTDKGDINASYASALAGINKSEELKDSSNRAILCGPLKHESVRAFAELAIMQGWSSDQAQDAINTYIDYRGLSLRQERRLQNTQEKKKRR